MTDPYPNRRTSLLSRRESASHASFPFFRHLRPYCQWLESGHNALDESLKLGRRQHQDRLLFSRKRTDKLDQIGVRVCRS